jgi:hypothetical protein
MMKICVLLVLVSASTLGFAQKSCADGTVLRGRATCTVGTCRETLETDLGQPCFDPGNCFELLTSGADCCGRTIPITLPTGNTCLFAALQDPNARSAIALLARRQRILIPTCTGAYLPAQYVL